MKLIVAKNYEELSKLAAKEFVDVINYKPNAIIGLATGSSPMGMYKELIKMYRNKEVDFSSVISFNLDEYVGLGSDHPQSYRYFMDNNFFDYVNINKANTFIANGLSNNLEEECRSYDNKIQELGGIDIQLLGIGNNGHIAFNEPEDELLSGTHIIQLTEDTIKANSRFFNSIDEVPKQALTMGLGGIMKAKKIVLIASGESKASAIQGLLSGKITTDNPATMLQMHRDVVVIVDQMTANLLKCKE